MIEFLLGLAQAVLGGVIAELFAGKRSFVRRDEIERIVAEKAGQRQFTDDELKIIVRRTMEEILTIVGQDKDLTWQSQRISPTKPVTFDPPKEMVAEQMERLEFLIQERREHLLAAAPTGTPGQREDTILWERVRPRP